MAKQEKSSNRVWLSVKLIMAILLLNLVFQIYQNPIHIFSFVSRPFSKTPQQTWKQYGEVFQELGDSHLTPELLAAIAQVESNGNPLAAPAWKVEATTDLAQIFAPASSAFGLMQITKGTFESMRIIAKSEGHPTPIMTRLSARDQIQLSVLHLRRNIQEILGQKGWEKLDRKRTTSLASVIHLCGPEIGRRLTKSGFRAERLPRCGSHWPQVYIQRVWELRQTFEKMTAADVNQI